MRLLVVTQYFWPENFRVNDLVADLVHRGHEVTVLTSWHDRSLPREGMTEDGVRVVRVPIAANLSRAVILPTLLPTAASLLRTHDVMNLHLPMAEATPLAALGRAMRKRVVVTHHSDLVLSSTVMEKVATGVGRASGIGAAHLAQDVVASTRDQASISPTVRGIGQGLHIIPPPVPTPVSTEAGQAVLRDRFAFGDGMGEGPGAPQADCEHHERRDGGSELARTSPRVPAGLSMHQWFPDLR